MKKFFKSELVRGGISLFILFNIFNFLGFLYQILMAKTLGPADYGVLAVLMSLFYFVSMPNEIIQTTVAKYTSKLKVQNEYGKIKTILINFIFNGLSIALIVFIVSLPLFYWYSKFVNVKLSLVILMGTMVFFSFSIPVSRGILQGMKKFHALGFNMVIDSAIKLFSALILVYFGFRVYGAILGAIIGVLFAFLFSFLPLKKIVRLKKVRYKTPYIFSQTSSVFFALIAILFIQSVDVILAKRFFSPVVAGQYAAASLAGKMIFLGTASIAKVLLPISSEKHENGKDTASAFTKSFLAISTLCIGATIVLVSFQDFFIRIIFTADYLDIKSILLYICISFSFISLANLVLIYGISTNKKIKFWHFTLFCVIQIGTLYLFHENVVSFSIAMLFVSFTLFLGSLIIVFKKVLNRT